MPPLPRRSRTRGIGRSFLSFCVHICYVQMYNKGGSKCPHVSRHTGGETKSAQRSRGRPNVVPAVKDLDRRLPAALPAVLSPSVGILGWLRIDDPFGWPVTSAQPVEFGTSWPGWYAGVIVGGRPTATGLLRCMPPRWPGRNGGRLLLDASTSALWPIGGPPGRQWRNSGDIRSLRLSLLVFTGGDLPG